MLSHSCDDVRLCSFSYAYTYQLDLHSFPTRRSSDLRAADRHGVPGPDLQAAGAEQPQLRHGPGGRSDRRDHPRLGGQDRKSTRLNSSHRCISYAVFCLKKKKKEEHEPDEVGTYYTVY